MREDDFERRRRELEEQLEKDLELVREAHRVKLRSLEELRPSAMIEEPGRPASQSLGAPSVPASPAAPRRPPGHLVAALQDVWDQLPADFDKQDLYRVLGHQPPRATVDRAISELLLRKKIVVCQTSLGWHRTRYQKVGDG